MRVAAVGALRTWFVAEKTRMTPHLRFARVVKDAKEKGSGETGTADGVIEGVYLGGDGDGCAVSGGFGGDDG